MLATRWGARSTAPAGVWRRSYSDLRGVALSRPQLSHQSQHEATKRDRDYRRNDHRGGFRRSVKITPHNKPSLVRVAFRRRPADDEIAEVPLPALSG